MVNHLNFFKEAKVSDRAAHCRLYSLYLVMEGLSILLKKEKEAGLLTGIKVARITKFYISFSLMMC
jgi:hypothetical protein